MTQTTDLGTFKFVSSTTICIKFVQQFVQQFVSNLYQICIKYNKKVRGNSGANFINKFQSILRCPSLKYDWMLKFM